MDPRTPRFSVITPAYRATDTIADTMRSVIAQTCDDWEMVVVDDGSPDETLSIARAVAAEDPRITVTSQENAGTSVARNTAIGLARGEYLVLLDSDDRLLPRYLEAMSALIDSHPGHAIYSCNATNVYPNGLRARRWTGRPFSRVRSFDLEEMLDRNLVHITAVLRRDVAVSVGGFAPGVRAQDYEMWLKVMLSGGTHLYTPEVLAEYLVLDSAMSTRVADMVADVIAFASRLRDEPALDPALIPALDRALTRWRSRLRIAEMEERLLDGDTAGARSIFLGEGRHLADGRKLPVAAPVMLISPRLYRAVFLRRFVRARRLRATGP